MKLETLRLIAPHVKTFVEGRGKHEDQLFPKDAKGLSVGAYVFKTGLMRHPWHNTYCFANMNGAGNGAEALLMQVQPPHDSVSEEAYRHYIEWMLNWSPWRNVFVTKSVNKVLKLGVVVIDPSFRAATVMGGMIALRYPWENHSNYCHYTKVPLWWELAKKIDPLEAFAVVNNIVLTTNPESLLFGEICSGHSALATGTGFQHRLDNFVRRHLVDYTEPVKIGGSGQASTIWDDKSKGLIRFSKKVEAVINTIGKKAAGANPFALQYESKRFTSSELVDCLSSNLPNMKEEIYGKA